MSVNMLQDDALPCSLQAWIPCVSSCLTTQFVCAKTIVFQHASCRRIGIVIESTDDFMYKVARRAIRVHDHLNELFEFGPTYA